jgi:hypothetical protein
VKRMRKNKKKYFSMSADAAVGVAGGAGQAVVSLEIPAGRVYEVWNIMAAYYSSVSLAGRLNVVQSTTAAVGGTDIIKAVLNFDPVTVAGPLGVACSKHWAGKKQPLCVIDNREGVVSVYLNIEIPIFVAIALVADAVTQEYAVTLNGLWST